ncbi:MAG: SDR family NAD(P)-dependent oxidoreductase [Bacteroidetes bacterium]|nr:SDR family NAD(P)-dependent oxidoreductase [Bacteroidota bacterium]
MTETPFHLHNKTILVTGASSGIGRQVAISASNMGATLLLSGRNSAELEKTISLLSGANHKIISADLLLQHERENLANEIPMLDGIVHCAGTVKPFPIKFLDQKKLDETLKINYEAPVLMMAAILKNKKLNKNASLVFLSSISGQHPHKGGTLYAGSKAAIESFAKVLSLELYPQGIRANCISPAMVKTPMFDQAADEMSKEEMDKHIGKYPLGVGLPEDVANAAIFLLSPAARWITGINITLDGGFLLIG